MTYEELIRREAASKEDSAALVEKAEAVDAEVGAGSEDRSEKYRALIATLHRSEKADERRDRLSQKKQRLAKVTTARQSLEDEQYDKDMASGHPAEGRCRLFADVPAQVQGNLTDPDSRMMKTSREVFKDTTPKWPRMQKRN